MPPSSELPSGQTPTSSFGSVDWLSRSSRADCPPPSSWAEVSRGRLSAPAGACRGGGPPRAAGVETVKSAAVSAPGTSTAGLSKEADSTRQPRPRTAFTEEQVSTLESCFQHHRYLGALERRRLARKMGLSEVQIKTWFQNRRMKHKRQLQDLQLSIPSLELPSGPWLSALCPGQVLQPWASLLGPMAVAQPHGSFRSPCPVEQASLASAWATSCGRPLMCCPPAPGSQAHMLGPALSRGTWGMCVLPETGDVF